MSLDNVQSMEGVVVSSTIDCGNDMNVYSAVAEVLGTDGESIRIGDFLINDGMLADNHFVSVQVSSPVEAKEGASV